MNISNLRQNNVNIMLAHYVIKPLKLEPLSEPLKWDHRISKYYLSTYCFSYLG